MIKNVEIPFFPRRLLKSITYFLWVQTAFLRIFDASSTYKKQVQASKGKQQLKKACLWEGKRELTCPNDVKDLEAIPISLQISTSKRETTMRARGPWQGRDGRMAAGWIQSDLSATYTFSRERRSETG